MFFILTVGFYRQNIFGYFENVLRVSDFNWYILARGVLNNYLYIWINMFHICYCFLFIALVHCFSSSSSSILPPSPLPCSAFYFFLPSLVLIEHCIRFHVFSSFSTVYIEGYIYQQLKKQKQGND